MSGLVILVIVSLISLLLCLAIYKYARECKFRYLRELSDAQEKIAVSHRNRTETVRTPEGVCQHLSCMQEQQKNIDAAMMHMQIANLMDKEKEV